jgi:hypothetical protein
MHENGMNSLVDAGLPIDDPRRHSQRGLHKLIVLLYDQNIVLLYDKKSLKFYFSVQNVHQICNRTT